MSVKPKHSLFFCYWVNELLYEQEKAMLGKTFLVTKEWKIGHSKMKVGDMLKVVDYGSGMCSHYVVFMNERIKTSRFHTGTWLFLRSTKAA